MIELSLLSHDNLDIIYDDATFPSNGNVGFGSLRDYREFVSIRIANELLEIYSTQEYSVLSWINDEYLNDNGCNFYSDFGYPILRNIFQKGEFEFMEEKNSKSEQELQQQEKWKENFKRIMEANHASKRTIFKDDNEMIEFIHNCEKVYNKTTDEHLLDHKKREFEGNVDERRWYRFAKYLKEKGVSF